jgi:hypothetical protein
MKWSCHVSVGARVCCRRSPHPASSPAPLSAFGSFGSAKLPGEHVCIIMSITRVCREYRVLEVFPLPKLRAAFGCE